MIMLKKILIFFILFKKYLFNLFFDNFKSSAILFFIALNFGYFALSQKHDVKIIRSTFSVLGHNINSVSNISVKATLGQPSNTITENNGGLVLRQGFQQPINDIDKKNIAITKFKMYPNPSKNKVNIFIDLGNLDNFEFDLKVYNTNSILIEHKRGIKNKQNYQLIVKSYPAGIYLVNLYNGNELIKSSKLVVFD